tara:strand:+ start:884 stop:1492 length:609 start_codon:yes stop_codon:yes gene_type:complete
MNQLIFGIPLFKYYLDPTEIQLLAEQKFQQCEKFPIHKTPSGWDCDLRTEFNSSRNNEYAHYYNGIMDRFSNDLTLEGGRCYIDESWINSYGLDENQEEHDHLPGFYSAIHYVKFNPEVHKPAVFINPLMQLYSYMNNEINYGKHPDYMQVDFEPDVKEGDIIIFPSWLKHTVKRNKTDQHRITLAFNINTMKGSTRRVFGQ